MGERWEAVGSWPQLGKVPISSCWPTIELVSTDLYGLIFDSSGLKGPMHSCRGNNLGLSAAPGFGFYSPRKIKPLKALLLISPQFGGSRSFFLQIKP